MRDIRIYAGNLLVFLVVIYQYFRKPLRTRQ